MADSEQHTVHRRTFLARVSAWFMAGGLAAGYGSCGAMGLRYLFPSRGRPFRWQFLARESDMKVGHALDYRAPSGEPVTVARRGAQGTAEDFVALSSTCPHLGCQVHWQPGQKRFFCPCHNGAFDPEGKPTAGPPLEANQSLPRYPLKVEEGVLFIEVPMESLPGPEGVA